MPIVQVYVEQVFGVPLDQHQLHRQNVHQVVIQQWVPLPKISVNVQLVIKELMVLHVPRVLKVNIRMLLENRDVIDALLVIHFTFIH
jgi:hypothetical protein